MFSPTYTPPEKTNFIFFRRSDGETLRGFFDRLKSRPIEGLLLKPGKHIGASLYILAASARPRWGVWASSEEDGVGIVTMNCLKNLNAIDEEMADELKYIVDVCEKDTKVKVVVLKG